MIKFTAQQPNGRPVLALGLSFKNLKEFQDKPGRTYIHVDGTPLGLPIDVLIFSGRTEQEMMRDAAELIGPNTKVKIDPRLKD